MDSGSAILYEHLSKMQTGRAATRMSIVHQP